MSFDTTIAVGEKGKPYFLYNESLHFSISHTKSHIAIALHDKEIGIDIENTRKCNLNLAKRYFHPEEYIYLSSLPKEEQDEAFTKIWTQKEAFVKCTGEGIAGGFNKFSVIPNSKNIDKKYILKYERNNNLSLCFIS